VIRPATGPMTFGNVRSYRMQVETGWQRAPNELEADADLVNQILEISWDEDAL
jgi:hypothetical protein